ncbi:hypothetical protein DIPPA_25088 [Diplonema papillatum]|nr:hypothetical protein DIPPA_25088 [Diplonema papillatum]
MEPYYGLHIDTRSIWGGIATILYWEGILASNAFADSTRHLQAKVHKVLLQLLHGEYRGADLDLKRCGKQGTEYPLYSAKLSKDDRLLFTTLQRGTSRQLLLLECVENHDYQKARFMKHGVLKAYMAHGTEWEAVDQPVVAPSPPRFNPKKVWSVLGGILSFTDLQESVLKMPTPLLILGAAGTGKTCIAQALLCKAAMHGCTSVLYVAQSRALVQVVSDSLTADPGVEVDVLTYSQLAQSTLSDYDEVGFETAYDKLSGKNEAFDAVAGRVYEELRIYSGCRDAEEYGALGVRQRLLQGERAGFVAGVYRQYQEYLAEYRRVDLAFAEVLLAEYDLVVVDEGQDFSRLQLKQLHAAARNCSLVVCMDPQQSIHDAISSKDYLTALCGPHDPPFSVATLPETFRTPLSVIPIVNRVLDLRRMLIGGVSHKDEYRGVHPSRFTSHTTHRGEVHWISPTEEACMRSLRDACGRFATFAVVVPSQEHVDSAVDMFDTALVLTAAQAKGLEYEHVVAVSPFPEGDPILAQAERKCPKTRSSAASQNHRTKDKSQTQDLAFLPPLNRVFITFTRTSNSLYIVQNPAVYPNLVGYIKRAEDAVPRLFSSQRNCNGIPLIPRSRKTAEVVAPTVTVPSVPDSSVTDWEKEMQRQQKRGNVDVARTIQNRQIDPERFRLEGDEHFEKGEYDLAVRAYRAALEGRRTAKVLCNLAEAQLKLCDLDGSIESCRGSVAADPTFGKAYFRLATALRQKGGDPDELLRAAVTAKSFFPDDRDVAALLQSVAPGCDVLSVSTQGYFTMICSIGLTEKYYVVLQPGQYTIIDPFPLSCNIVGVGNPTVATDSKRVSHVVDATNGVRLLLAGVTFRGSSREQVSAICSSSRSTVTMLDCTVRGFSDNAVLSIGDCNVKNCTFQDLRLAGIEVRDGGSARVVGSTFERCRQGVAAYGGFALLKLHRSTVSDCEREGLLVHGTSNSPGMTGHVSNDHVAHKAFLRGCNKGAKSTATISECHILGNRGPGVSIDLGVTANVLKTRISNNGSKGLTHGVFKHGVLVKGGSTVLLHTCAFSKNGDSGVRIENNWAEVSIFGCVFAEEKKNIDELTLYRPKLHRTPAERSEIKEVSYARQLPDVTASASTAAVASAPKDKGAEQERNPLVKPVFCPLLKPYLSRPYMAMGTTKGVEVVCCPVEGPEWYNVLLGACGDVRNVLTTMASEHTKTGRFHLVLNDVEPAILARDLVLLNIATGRDAAHCLSVWGNHFLSSDCSKAMLGVIGTLLDGTAPLSGDMDDATKEAVHKVLRTWLTLKPKAGTLQRNLTEETLDQAVAFSVQASAGVDRKVVAQYFKDGFLPTGSRAQGRFTKSPNVTLFPHGGHYDMYPTCSIFRAVPSPSVAALQQTVQAQCAALRKALGEDRLRVTVVCKDLLAFLKTTNLRSERERPGEGTAWHSNVYNFEAI